MQTERKEGSERIPNVERDDWNVKELAEESANKPTDETLREVLRGAETKGDAEERDIVGRVDSNETQQGREEAKKGSE